MSGLEELYRCISACTDCNLSGQRTHAVPGEGNPRSEVLFVGEAPGFYEDQQSRPFVGPAGRFLDELIVSAGLLRSDVYITNVVKCRPPSNRDPMPEEIEACRGYLQRQIEEIKPKLIITLGRYSLAWFFPKETIGRVHGVARFRDGIHFMPMYHPAAALHAGKMRKVIEEDFRKIPEALMRIRESEDRANPMARPAPEPEQMRMF